MKRYLYFSVTPEALISSMLPPDEFGSYLAVGTHKRTRGQVVFFEVDADKAGDYIPKDYIEERCVPHKDGSPKRSLYLSIYRVLETIPLDAILDLYLTTDDGRVLKLAKATNKPSLEQKLHLYQELCPVTPRVASTLAPQEFLNYVTDPETRVYVPRLFFVELRLNGLATDPIAAKADDLPYGNIPHLRDCLIGLKQKEEKVTKTVIRFFSGDVHYRTCINGFFLGNKDKSIYYPFPSKEELEGVYHTWWRSAVTIGF